METKQHKAPLATDAELIEKIIEGETALFEILIRRYNPLLYKIARSYGLGHHDAEDAMQETHCAAYLQLKSFRHEASYKTWITRIILNKCHHRVNYGNGKYEHSDNELITENAQTMHASGTKDDTEKVIINRELATVLETSLQQLPIPYRSVFVLREMEGFPVAETATLLNITPTNVKVRLNRAKAMLQKQISGYYSSTELFEFHLRYCDGIVNKVFQNIALQQG
jgi:RNA polymerase sigma factor (sigma-70 family)